MTLYYITLHYITLHHITVHYIDIMQELLSSCPANMNLLLLFDYVLSRARRFQSRRTLSYTVSCLSYNPIVLISLEFEGDADTAAPVELSRRSKEHATPVLGLCLEWKYNMVSLRFVSAASSCGQNVHYEVHKYGLALIIYFESGMEEGWTF